MIIADGTLGYTHVGQITFHAVVHDDGSFADYVMNPAIGSMQNPRGRVSGNSIEATCWNIYCDSHLTLAKVRTRPDE